MHQKCVVTSVKSNKWKAPERPQNNSKTIASQTDGRTDSYIGWYIIDGAHINDAPL